MKSSIKIIVFVGLLLCSMKAWAQDDTANQTIKTINKALSQGDCDRAQRAYNAWKVLTESTNSSIENRIKSCQDVKKRQQVIEEQKKQQPTSVAQRFKVGEVTTLIVNDHQITGRVAYLDATQKHGLLFVEKETHPSIGRFNSYVASPHRRLPTKAELSLIYKNKNLLGLHDEYWSQTANGKHHHYTLDFSIGKFKSRRTGNVSGFGQPNYYYCYKIFVADF